MEVEEKIKFGDLPTNLISFIYQFLPEKDIFAIAHTAEKFHEALKKDFLMEELVRRDKYFISEEESRAETWYEIFKYLKEKKKNEKKGTPRNYKMTPYRGHKFPIEAFYAFENENNFGSTIVSGDSDGNVFTWNLEVDEDDEDEKIMNPDLIIKADGKIKGIQKLNDSGNKMIIWTEYNKFYIYNVLLHKSKEFVKNSKRFQLITEFYIEDVSYTVKQIYYDKKSDKIYLSADFSGKYGNTCIYSFNLKSLSLDQYNFSYDKIQSELVKKDEAGQGQQNNQIIDPFEAELEFFMNDTINNSTDAYFKKRKISNFVICGDKLILYINFDPVKKILIEKYNCRKLLPNAYYFDLGKKSYKDYHIDLKYINDIVKINEDKVGFIGINNNNKLVIQIYSSENSIFIGEGELFPEKAGSIHQFDFLYSNLPEGLEFYYLINNNQLYKMNLGNFKQIKKSLINNNMNAVSNVNCIESDKHKIVLASSKLYIAIFDIISGEFWYIFLGGSLTVIPKSFLKHPNFEGFHILQVTNNSVIAAHGNLIREYKFVFD